MDSKTYYIEPPELDKRLGMLVYVTKSPPVAGRIKESFEDFYVEEIIDLKIVKSRLERGYAVYIMEKRNMDTFSAIAKAAKLLDVPSNAIGYAGLKDTVAVTRQYITVPVEKLKTIIENVEDKKLSLRFVGFSNRGLKPGRLVGNKFKIAISLESGERLDKLLNALKELSEVSGIAGFYGYQRFGVRRPNTHIVGKLMVKRLWDEAVREIAGHPYPWEPPQSYEARVLFEEGNLQEAFKKFPKSLFYERFIVKKLQEGWDPVKILRALPSNLRHLYVSGYQSYLFNTALSRRLMETDLNPTKILEGDIVKGVKDESMIRAGLSILYMVTPGVGRLIEKLKGDCIRIIKQVMEEEDVKPEDFKIDELNVVCKASLREVFMKFRDLALIIQPSSKPLLSFTLPQGGYATVLLRELLKQDPLKANFR
ncbi:MAG: tRNA pseudouridine(13) synthase TruD [Candidatus Bathyarchaeia archaeon]